MHSEHPVNKHVDWLWAASDILKYQRQSQATSHTHTHTHTHTFNGPFPGLPGLAGPRKVKPICILLKQETVSGSGISWAICKSAPRSRQIAAPAPHHSVFYRPDALPATQPTASKQRSHKPCHWRTFWLDSLEQIYHYSSNKLKCMQLIITEK